MRGQGQDGGFQVHQLLRVAVLYCLLEGHVDVVQQMVTNRTHDCRKRTGAFVSFWDANDMRQRRLSGSEFSEQAVCEIYLQL